MKLFEIWQYCRDEHRSGWIGLNQDLSQFWPDQDWIGLHFFSKLAVQDWIGLHFFSKLADQDWIGLRKFLLF